jgi:hypothetical protein
MSADPGIVVIIARRPIAGITQSVVAANRATLLLLMRSRA